MASDMAALTRALTTLNTEGVKVVPATSNPGPLGLLGFGLTTCLLQGVFTTMVEGASTSLVFSFGFFFGGLAQFVAGLLEYQRKNTFGTVAFCCYGAFWMAVALDGTLRTAGVYTGVDLKGEQMMLSLWGILTFILWLCTFSMNVAISSLFFTLSLLFWFLAGGQKNATLLKFAGGWGILVSAIAFYCALAALMEDCYNKPILPTWPLKAINNVQLHNIGTKRNIEVDEV